MFKAVCDGCQKRAQLQNVDAIGYFEWVTRYNIADEYKAVRIIPYQVKLLESLSKPDMMGIIFIQAKKRTRWRWVQGVRRPGGFEWVYRPVPTILQVLADHQNGKLHPPEPEKESGSIATSNRYEDVRPYDLPPLTLTDQLGAFREELGEAFKYIFSLKWLND